MREGNKKERTRERERERERERVNLNGNLKAAAGGVVVGKVLSEDRQRF